MDKEYLIQKWLADELSAEEFELFEALEGSAFMKGVTSDAAAFKASQFSGARDYQELKTRIQKTETPVKIKKLHWVKPLLRIASVLVVGLALYFIFLYENLTELQSDFGQKISITLPDASSVTMNAITEIAYNEKKWKKNRKIVLEGEAFFDVAKGAQFDVITAAGKVTVLGTEFNVKQRGTYFEVKCFEGSVQVTSNTNDAILHEGDYIRFLDGQVITGKNTAANPSWFNNLSDFQRIPVSEIFEELERQYGIKIILEEVNTSQLFTGAFVHDNLDHALISITEPLDLDYTILQKDKVRIQAREK
ncbi:MAG: FecR domain-containing protein [Flavobacteriaceae bacterium]|nr:FecR domain-containing protein [Flavobacteriaceae bacterium]MDH3795420.1 FecR domain-containing protein [Flavobacteriaceae bacterium]